MRIKVDQDGFTLIEIIVVLVILAVIATIAIPNIISSINESRKSTDIASGKIIADAAGRVLALEGKYSGLEISALDLSTIGTVNPDSNPPYDDEFQADLYVALNSDIPYPKFTATDIDEDNFILNVSSGRIIDVYIGSGTDISSPNSLVIYPVPDDVYTN